MKLIKMGNAEQEAEHGGFPTVGEMLEYIKNNNIPMDAEVVVEHVNDYYVMQGEWAHYRCGTPESIDGVNIMLPAHNGFGSIEDKKYFAIWMHY